MIRKYGWAIYFAILVITSIVLGITNMILPIVAIIVGVGSVGMVGLDLKRIRQQK